MHYDTTVLKKRQATLDAAQKKLKEHFVGIDHIIDEFIHQVRVWYLMPELLTKPVIINLWGMTGVGKTDLIRKFVEYLDFQDNFAEIELSNSERSGYFNFTRSVADALGRSGIFPDQHTIVFFDEIQKFRTLDEDRKEITTVQFQDFWELLSDGKLAQRERVFELEELLFESVQEQQRARIDAENSSAQTDAPPQKKLPNYVRWWNVNKIKPLLGSKRSEDYHERLATLTEEDIRQLIQEQFSSKKAYQVQSYFKTLIIIGGNLDEAYEMAKQTQEAEVDPDIFKALAAKINILDIKRALSKRFRPEQVSRFGNIHILYPSLSQKDFQKLIARNLSAICTRVHQSYDITLIFDDSIYDLIYVNGVFPTQGVRPVFSAVGDIVESNLAEHIFVCLTEGYNQLSWSYDASAKEFTFVFGIHGSQTKKILTKHYVGRLDVIRNHYSKQESYITAVHEAGHAVVYACLFGLAPLQLRTNLASTDTSGFTFPHQIKLNKQRASSKIQVLLAGLLSEKLILGEEKTSLGSAADIESATRLAAEMIRKHGLAQMQYRVVPQLSKEADDFSTSFDVTNEVLREMMQAQYKASQKILIKNREFLLAVVARLQEHGAVSSESFVDIAQSYGIACRVEDETFIISGV